MCACLDNMHKVAGNEFLCEKLGITRNTASKYLHELTEAGILVEEKVGKTKLYKNAFLYNLIRLW